MIEFLQQRLDSYDLDSEAAQDNALKEITQEVLLFALFDAGFYDVAAFQGGASLRVVYGLPRFSEDIDFILKQPDPLFSWQPYLEQLITTSENFGIKPEVRDKSRMDQNIRKAVIKDNSIANQLDLSFVDGNRDKELNIKLEIDCNPPAGSGYEYSYLKFPVDFEICHQDLSSNFSLKIHALLCRGYLKGRDWYDFSWYVSREIAPNMELLENTLIQYGSWQGQDLKVNREWLIQAMQEKIATIDWQDAANDVLRFLHQRERSSLRIWSQRFFQSKLTRLDNLLMGGS